MLLSNLILLATAPGGVARLRELILTLAVQGKLVPQDPADEPASRLLQKIQAEKDRLIAEGKIKKDKPLAAIAEEEKPFALPVGWEWVRNQALLTLRKGKNPKSLSDQPIGKPYLDIEALDRHQIRRYSDESQVVLCSSDDILVVCDGSRSGLILQGKDGIVGSTLAVIETPQYIQPYISLIFRAGFRRFNSGMKGAAIPHLDTKTVLGEVSGLPSLAEQSRIVARVEELMRLCDALEAKGQLEATQHAQLLSTLLGTLTASATPEELADNWQRVAQHFDLLLDRPQAIDALEQTLLQLAVRGLLVPQDPADEPASVLLQKIRAEKDRLIAAGQIKRDKPLPPITDEEKPFELPVGWEWVRMDSISEFTNGFAFPSSQFSSDSTGVGIIKIGDIQDGAVKTSGMSFVSRDYAKTIDTAFDVAPGDMLIAMSGATTGKLGFNLTGSHFLLNQRVGKIRLHLIDQQYAYSYLQTKVAENLSISAGSAIPNLSTAQIKEILFPLPPLAEQSRIVTRITQLRRLCADLRQRLAEREAVQARLAEALAQSVA